MSVFLYGEGGGWLLLQHLQVEGRGLHAVHLRDFFEGCLQCRAWTGFYGHYKSQAVLGIAGLLQERVDVDSLLG